MTENRIPTEIPDLEKLYPLPYTVLNNKLYILESVRGSPDPISKPLCNFVPFFTAQLFRDEGDCVNTAACLSAVTAAGEILPEITVSSEDFSSMNWITASWGFGCNLEPGSTVRDRLRYALQTTAEKAPTRTEYKITGWKRIDNHWEYLMPGNSERTVKLEDNKLFGYRMPSSFSEEDIASARRLLDCTVAPKEILYPLIAFTFLSPLNSFLREAGFDPTAVLFLCGRTGSYKSTLAALMLSFFGKFTSSTLPLSFRDTANSIVSNTYLLKDVLTCIDDYHPTGSSESSKMKETAQTIMRAYGDRVGRGRLRSNCEPMMTRCPQGNALVTAEFQPDIGESGTARYILVEMEKNSVNLSALTLAQKDAADGRYAACMSAYIGWLKENFLSDDDLYPLWLEELNERFGMERNRLLKTFRELEIRTHARIPGAVSVMRLGFRYFLDFLYSRKQLSSVEKERYLSDFDSVLFEIARQQSGTIRMNNPAYRYLIKISAMLEAGRWFVSDRNAPGTVQEKNLIGYEDADCYYFLLTDSHRMVRRLCEEQGEEFNITEKVLTKLLDEEHLILTDKNSHLKNVRIGNRTKRFVTVPKDTIKKVYAMYLNPDATDEDASAVPLSAACPVSSSIADNPAADPADSTDDLPF